MPKQLSLPVLALVAAPLAALAAVLLAPTVSDDAGDRLAAFTDHRGAQIASMSLQVIAIVLLIAGIVWLAVTQRAHAPRLSLWGGVLGVAGSLVVLFEDGVAAAAPAIVQSLDPAHAQVVLEAIERSAAVKALEPFSLAGDVGLALLAFAAARAGAPRWVAAAVTLGAFGEGFGFATATRAVLIAGFALLFVGLAALVRSLRSPELRLRGAEPATA